MTRAEMWTRLFIAGTYMIGLKRAAEWADIELDRAMEEWTKRWGETCKGCGKRPPCDAHLCDGPARSAGP